MAHRSTPAALALVLVLTGGAVQLAAPAFGESVARAAPAPHSAAAPDIYPDANWQTQAPDEHGLTADGLQQLVAAAERLDSACLMVIHDGVLVGEWYWNGFDRNTKVVNAFSTTKSVTSTLIGIAQDSGKLDIGQTAATYISSWAGTASEPVTLRNLISNDSGRFWSFESDYVTGLVPALDQTAYAVSLAQQFDPGTTWEYNNAAIQTLEEVLSQSLQQDVGAFAQAQLFDKIGSSARMTSDPAGNALAYQGVTASCDDMARFGYLALREGRWKDQQVVSKQWIQQATKPSTELNSAYGYMWWTNREGHVVLPSFPGRNEYDGRLVPDASEQLFFALGAFGQVVIVDPVDEYVVVRLQNITDLNAALATSPDSTGVAQLREITTAFEGAKKKGKGKGKGKGKDKGKDKDKDKKKNG